MAGDAIADRSRTLRLCPGPFRLRRKFTRALAEQSGRRGASGLSRVIAPGGFPGRDDGTPKSGRTPHALLALRRPPVNKTSGVAPSRQIRHMSNGDFSHIAKWTTVAGKAASQAYLSGKITRHHVRLTYSALTHTQRSPPNGLSVNA